MHEVTPVAAEIVAGHERRLAALDPLLPATHPLPDPDPDPDADPDDVLLSAEGGTALARRHRPDPESFLATWGAADQHGLRVRIAERPDPVGAMETLLGQWRDRVHAQLAADPPGTDPRETEAGLTWPSRDTAMTTRFLAHGLAPAAVIAARPQGRQSPEPPPGVPVRPIEARDLDAAAQLWLQLVHWDTQFGTATERPSTYPAIRQELAEALAGDPPWAWVAEADRQVAGLLVVSPPEHAGWVAPLTRPAPAAYLGCLGVAAGRRGDGLGAALVRQAHAALDAAGVAVTLLHYAALSPLSGPFWHHCGYRPLWTSWQARPAARLR